MIMCITVITILTIMITMITMITIMITMITRITIMITMIMITTKTPSPPTKSFDFREFDSSRLLILKGENSHVRMIL